MRRELVLTREPIDEGRLAACRALGAGIGATVSFSGIVRGMEAGEPIAAIEYEAFEKMVRHQFERIFDEAEKRWPIAGVRLVHRLGVVRVGEASLWVEVIAPHRSEAFAAGQFIVDEMKRWAPIWKKPLRNFL